MGSSLTFLKFKQSAIHHAVHDCMFCFCKCLLRLNERFDVLATIVALGLALLLTKLTVSTLCSYFYIQEIHSIVTNNAYQSTFVRNINCGTELFLSEYLRLVVVGPVPAAAAAGPRGVLEEGLVVEPAPRARARLVVRDVARLPRRGQRQLGLRLRVRVDHAHILPLLRCYVMELLTKVQ